MEGKGCLFKKFAGIDVFDIELAENDPDKLVDIDRAMEPTFGGINLEDIKAPECFYIEQQLRERMNIPVFHDDQHGTAIIAAAAILNGLELVGKNIDEVKLVVSGAGAAAHRLPGPDGRAGPEPRKHPRLPDSKGVLYVGRRTASTMNPRPAMPRTRPRAPWPMPIEARTSSSACRRAASSPRHGQEMAPNPLILALANPDAGDPPGAGLAARPDCDHCHRPLRLSEPGQQRPVLPVHLPRRAGPAGDDDHAEMKLAACGRSRISPMPKSGRVANAYAGAGPGLRPRLPHSDAVRFAPDPIVAPAVAKAAADFGVAPLIRRVRFLVGQAAAGRDLLLHDGQPEPRQGAEGARDGVHHAGRAAHLEDRGRVPAGGGRVHRSAVEGGAVVDDAVLLAGHQLDGDSVRGADGDERPPDTGFQARGYLLDRQQLEYRLAVTQGLRNAAVAGAHRGSRNSFRTTFGNYNFFETENGYVLGGTNLGKKKMLNLSGGVDTQSTYSAYSANLFATLPTGKGGEIGGQADLPTTTAGRGSRRTGSPRQNDYLVEAAFLIPESKVQPFAKWELQKMSDTYAVSKDDTRWGVGLNYYVSKQNLKLTAQYLRISPDASTIPSTNEFTLQLQLFYF